MVPKKIRRFFRKFPFPKIFRAVRIASHAAALSAAIATLLGFAGTFWWGFEWLDHPRPQYCLLLVFAIVVGAFSRRAWSFLWCVPLILNLVVIVPLFMGPEGVLASPPANPTCRLVHINLDRDNQNFTRAIEYIDAQNADLIFLQEVTPQWLTQLQANLSRYQVAESVPLENSHGVAMLQPVERSPNFEVIGTQVVNLPPDSDRPMLAIAARWGEQEVAILSFHVIFPRDRGSSAFQQIEFNAAAQWSRTQQQQNREVILIGDFNSTPWSARFQRLLQESKLKNSQRGFGLQPTWIAGFPPPLSLPIDHCLHSLSLLTLKRAIGENIGSQHLPLIVELGQRS